MKSFVATLILLSIVIGGTVWNFQFVNRTADRMDDLIAALPGIENADCLAKTQEIRAYWEERVPALRFSVGYAYLDRVGEQTALLCACAEIGDLFGFRSAAALLSDAVKDMRRGERFFVANLF